VLFSAVIATVGQGAIAGSVNWIEDIILGSVAISIATIAVAFLGMAMLNGRLDTRLAVRTAVGAFLIFGSAGVAKGIMANLPNQAYIPAEPEAVAAFTVTAPSVPQDAPAPNQHGEAETVP
jgi:type IV secretion system protein VirB2